MKIAITKGKVILAGAGPGDPELLSLKAHQYLQKADVVLTDRLVSPDILSQYTHPNAEIIYVGKQCSKGIHTPQQDINQLLVECAMKYKLVVRLKGGDVSLFSNVLDELQILKENRIDYEIVPGISAAFGAAAYTGIPLTARGYARGVRFLTLYDLKHIQNHEWQDWASTQDTLVFYMSGLKLQELAQNLMATQETALQGKRIAVIQQATTPDQCTQIFEFDELLHNQIPEFAYVPTLIMVGSVVALHEQFAWVDESPNPALASTTVSYFDQRPSSLSKLYKNAI